MDGIREVLEAARDRGLVSGNFRGLLHIAIGRTVSRPDGTTISKGLTWREVASTLKALRFDRELVREFGADPDQLAPRDRERFWYSAIAAARVDSPEAIAQADRLVGPLKGLGYLVAPFSSTPAAELKPRPKAREEKPPKKKKK